jgi:hypothetical protein
MIWNTQWIASLGWVDCWCRLWLSLLGGAIAIVTMILKHQERIAKIERGIDPDASPRN